MPIVRRERRVGGCGPDKRAGSQARNEVLEVEKQSQEERLKGRFQSAKVHSYRQPSPSGAGAENLIRF